MSASGTVKSTYFAVRSAATRMRLIGAAVPQLSSTVSPTLGGMPPVVGSCTRKAVPLPMTSVL